MPPACLPQIRLLVHGPGLGVAGSGADGSLRHRDIPQWGIRQATGALGDANLLLVVDQLVYSSVPAGQVGIADPTPLWQALCQTGRIVPAPLEARQWLPPDVNETVPPCPDGVARWLAAQRAAGAAWQAQEALAATLHQAKGASGVPWREALREAGLAQAKHLFRNRLQTLDVLATLGTWGVRDDDDGEIAHEVLGSASIHVWRNLAVADLAAAIPHDWDDMAPLYACCGLSGEPWLTLRLPALSGANPAAVADLLHSDALAQVREALRVALSSGECAGVADAVAEALERLVPAGLRAQGLHRTLMFHGRVAIGPGDSPSRGSAALAISSWRPGSFQ